MTIFKRNTGLLDGTMLVVSVISTVLWLGVLLIPFTFCTALISALAFFLGTLVSEVRAAYREGSDL